MAHVCLGSVSQKVLGLRNEALEGFAGHFAAAKWGFEAAKWHTCA